MLIVTNLFFMIFHHYVVYRDNWTYEDVTRFVMDPSCVDAVVSGADGAHRVTASFMQRNALYSKRNFGSQADNATGIVMYVSSCVGFPTGPEFEK
jgi:hypothetical protein